MWWSALLYRPLLVTVNGKPIREPHHQTLHKVKHRKTFIFKSELSTYCYCYTDLILRRVTVAYLNSRCKRHAQTLLSSMPYNPFRYDLYPYIVTYQITPVFVGVVAFILYMIQYFTFSFILFTLSLRYMIFHIPMFLNMISRNECKAASSA